MKTVEAARQAGRRIRRRMPARAAALATSKVACAAGAAAAVTAATVLAAGASVAAASRPHPGQLADSVAPFTMHSQATGVVAGVTKLTIQVWLQPQLAAAERFATAVSTPGSPAFGRYLSPAAYTRRFAASAGEAAAVASWLRGRGFTGVRADAGRSYVSATGTVSRIETAFGTQVRYYRPSKAVNAGPYRLFANATPLTVPSALASRVVAVTGLSNAAPILPLERGYPRLGAGAAGAGATKYPCSHYYGQHVASGWLKQFGSTTFPTEVCGYSAGQVRAAYAASSQATGTGQRIALIELGLTKDMFLTLADYAKANQMPAPSPERYAELSLGRGTQCGDFFDIEEQLDVEASYDMAPGASQLVVGGDSCNNGFFGLQGLLDADLAVLAGNGSKPLVSAASNSWGSGPESQPPAITKAEHAILVRAAAEGVGEYFSSGDFSGVFAPANDPYAIAVGGTSAGIGKQDNRLFETGWSDGAWIFDPHAQRWFNFGEEFAAGGGPSLIWRQPAYQHGVVPTALAEAPGNRGGLIRSVPDISADADLFTGMAVGVLTFHKHTPPTYGQSAIGGTSMSAPLVAGMVMAAQQGGTRSFGFINPAIYKLAGTSAFFDPVPATSHTPAAYRAGAVGYPAIPPGQKLEILLDDQSPAMFGYTGQVTLHGYDNMTGVGTPNGPAFIKGLRALQR